MPALRRGLGWRLKDARWKCAGCDRKVSATAGTIFDKTRTPLTVWFATAWRMVGDKVGVSATQIQREMELGSYQTAWAMLHRYRSVMVRPGRDRLRGDVEVDESFLGGPKPGMPGRGALGKVLFAGAVERDDIGFGRARLAVIADASATSLAAFLADTVEAGSSVITDGWASYPAATRGLYDHHGTSVSASGLQAHEVLPAVHRVFSLVKRWIGGTCKAPSAPSICKPISTSGSSVSTAGTHAAAACCSAPCSATQAPRHQSATRCSAKPAGAAPPPRPRPGYEDCRPA